MEGGFWEIEEIEEEVVVQVGSSYCDGRVAASNRNASTNDADDVYVAVGKSNSSMEALSFALKYVAKPSCFVYLVHVFPEVHHIPTPLGMLPKSQVTPAQLETFMSQERAKRREMLQKYLNLCQAYKVEVDTVLIESDQVVKAVLELIPVLNIKRIFVGTSKSSIRKLKKATSKAELIHKSAPHSCGVKIICDGKEVTATNQISPAAVHSDSPNGNIEDAQQYKNRASVSCMCFARKITK